ncbi:MULTISPECIES: DUF6236 family protein [unclassified Streptomyces]|uniref:DUF6236 family protein n=1 Tax=unclassified Streptomyces TaxID=2593676 RepID=UPI0036F0B7DA
MRDLQLIERTRFDPVSGVRDDLQWIGMHPHLASIYSCALASRIAEANALTPVTDDPQTFALPGRGTAQELGAALLHPALPEQAKGQAAALYACAAVRVVVPANISQIPVDRIIRARQVLSEEFEAFRAHIDGLNEEFALLDGVEDPGILRARLDSMIERDMTKPTQELERGLRALGLEPARTVFGLKTLELPAIAALAAHTLHLSPIAGAGGAIAVQLLASARTAQREAATQRTSAAGYLLGLRRELEPAGFLARMRHALRGHR